MSDSHDSLEHTLILQASTDGTIHVSYSYVNRPHLTLDNPSDVFHTRQLSYPLMVTVYHMLECHDMDILPFSSFETSEMPDFVGDPENQAQRSCLDVGGEVGWCLFSIEVRNTYGLPFEVTFERVQEGVWKFPCINH